MLMEAFGLKAFTQVPLPGGILGAPGVGSPLDLNR
jgi:hypothetical protein